MDFPRLHQPLRAVVVGANGGIGHALCEALAESPQVAQIYAFSRQLPRVDHPKICGGVLELADESSISAAANLAAADGPIDLVLLATGLLHATGVAPEKRWESLDAAVLSQLFLSNSIGPALCAKHFLPRLRQDTPSVFAALSARVGSIGDNRSGGWYGYRASKAALNMLLRTLALELARRNPRAICVGLHPGTVDTPLSRPFQTRVPPAQLFTPARSAQALLTVCAGLEAHHSGQVLAWDGSPVIP